MKKIFYITTPIYYVNDKPHLGHAYTTIAADVLARFKRLQGQEVFFLTGTDEHGEKIAQSAKKNKKTPQEFCDEQSAIFQMAWDSLNISNNDFIRTTEERHEKVVQNFLNILYEKNLLYKDKYEGLYCVGCEAFKTDSELVDGKCPDHNKVPVLLSEENWFFKFSQFNDRLSKLIEKDEILIRPRTRKNEMLAFLKEGLQDFSISREKVEWGIKLPFDKKHTCYVWIDALINYISAVGFGMDTKRFEQIWPADIHFMAKEIVRFHALVWPAMLLAVGLALPKQIFAHGFFTIEGKKMSKTIGNVIDPMEISKRYGVDGLRYLIMREISFGEDGDVSVARFDERYNADLANGLGNLVARVFAMASQEEIEIDYDEDSEFKKQVAKTWKDCEELMTNFKFNEALVVIWGLISFCDKYVDEKRPWELKKTNPKKLAAVLSNLLETIRQIAWLVSPFMPETAEEILTRLKVYDLEKTKALIEIKKWGNLRGPINISKGRPLFERL